MPKNPDKARFPDGVFPLGRRGLRHMVVEQDGALWLSLAAEGAVSMIPTDPRPVGLFEINLLSDEKSIPYTYSSDGFTAKLSCPQGMARITHDRDANALRITAQGVSLRLDGKSPSGVSSLNIGGGAVVNIGGGRYFFTAVRGSMRFDDTWMRNQFCSVTPVVDISPDAGALELAAYELPADTNTPTLTKSFDECAAENRADFTAFVDTLADVPGQWKALREELAYLIWINSKRLPNGHLCVVPNRVSSTSVLAWQQAIASLAYTDAACAVDLLLSVPEASPPLYGFAVTRLIADGLLERVPLDTLRELYFELVRSEKWWRMKRSNNSPVGMNFYAYHFESALSCSHAYENNEPLYTPDLNAYLVLQSEALSALATIFSDTETARVQGLYARLRTVALTDCLWDKDGQTFNVMACYTGEKATAAPDMSQLPSILGDRLAGGVLQSLVSNVSDNLPHDSFSALTVLGLKAAGFDEKARTLAAAMLEHASSGGVTCPVFASALIALAARCI